MKIILPAILSFGFFASAAVPPLALEVLAMPEQNRILVAKEKSQELYPSLITLAQSDAETMQVRWKALTLAAQLNPKLVLPELEKAIKSPLWFMRNAALVAMQSQHPQAAKKAALVLIKDKALVVRSAAVDALGADLDSASRDLLWEEMEAKYNYRKNQSLWIREQILGKLALSPEPREAALFYKALNEKNTKMHEPAILALENLNQRKLGSPSQKVSQKRELWLQWAKAHSAEVN
jgi:hypothetical protein